MSVPNPLVSICIANYNNGAYLGQAIESALQQTFYDLEVIVCDNQSADNSLEVARSFCDSRLRVYANKRNLGIYGNFARTTELARGRYLKFLCADDWLDVDYLEVALAYFDKYPQAGLVTTRQTVITEEGRVITRRDEAIKGKDIYTPDEYFNVILRRINPIGNPTRVIVRHDAFDAVGGFDPGNEYAGDLDLWLRIAAKYPIAAVPEIHCYERKHATQSTHLHVKQATDIRDCCLAFKKNFEDLPDFWTLERRIELCRHGLAPFARHAISTWLTGDRRYFERLTEYMSELCPARYWLLYHVFSFPWAVARMHLYRQVRRLGIRREGCQAYLQGLKISSHL